MLSIKLIFFELSNIMASTSIDIDHKRINITSVPIDWPTVISEMEALDPP